MCQCVHEYVSVHVCVCEAQSGASEARNTA